MSGFRPEDDEDLSSLLPSTTLTSSFYAQPTPDDDLSSNPFADMASSTVGGGGFGHDPQPSSPPPRSYSPPPLSPVASYQPPSAYEAEPQRQDSYDGGGFAPVEDYSAPVAASSAGATAGFSNYVDDTPFYEPPPMDEPMPSMILSNPTTTTTIEQTPFGSPLASPVFAPPSLATSTASPYSPDPFAPSTTSSYLDSTPTHNLSASTSSHTTPADLADLFGEEQPILPSFKKKMANEPTFRRDMFEQMAAEEKAQKMAEREEARLKAEAEKSGQGVLPVSSIGRRKVGGSLATLLGLEPDEEEVKREEERKRRDKELLEKKAHEQEKEKEVEKEDKAKEVEPEVKAEPAKEGAKSYAAAAAEPAPPTEPATTKPDEADAPAEAAAKEPATAPTEAAEPTEAGDKDGEPADAPVVPEEGAATPVPVVEVTPTPAPDDEVTPAAEPGADEEKTPISTPLATTPSIAEHPAEPPAPAALATPLPPSPSVSPAPPADEEHQVTPTLSRSASLAPSIAASDAASSSGRSIGYDAVVSPMNPTGEGEGWPGSENLTTGLEGRLNELAVGAAEGERAAEPEPTPTGPDPFASFYQSPEEPRPSVVLGDNDGDSLRGTYSRSVDAASLSGDTETGRASPENGRSLPVGSSPALPPLPSFAESAGSPPRSAELGGSLGPSFVITVGDPQKVGSALNVAAQHTVYTVHTRTTHPAFRKKDFSVLRRFSHFLWLFDQLTANNPGVIVPGMPEKSVVGRFGSEFIENRRSGLQAALMKIVAHPMLVGDPDLRLFLESDSFAVEIKQRKVDGHHEPKGFLASLGVSLPGGPSFTEFDEYFDQRKHTLDTFETQLKALLAAFHAAAGQRMALQNGLADLEAAFAALAHCEVSASLSRALEAAATVQKRLRAVGEEQHRSEEAIGGLVSVAEGYARLCGSAKLVFGARIKTFHAWQAAEEKLRKAKAKRGGRDMLGLSVSEIAEDGSLRLVFGNQAERRALDSKSDFEDVSKLTKAEMARFDKEKVDDLKRAIEDYAEGLARRQREVVGIWQSYTDLLMRATGTNATPVLPGDAAVVNSAE